mgnify:CR=1 FL=1
MLITGTLKCSKCNRNIEWEYIVPQKLGNEPLQTERLDNNKAHPYKHHMINENEYLLRVRCKH